MKAAPAKPRGLDSLGPRERDILARRAGGAPFKEIAFDLGISIKTVEYYWMKIKAKMGMGDVVQICRAWWEQERKTAGGAILGLMLMLALALPARAWECTLAWDPPRTNADQVAGYKLHWGWVFFGYTNSIDVGTNLVATITNLDRGSVYRFAATAYDASGHESPLQSRRS